MVIPSDQLNQRSEEPGSICNEVVAAPVVPQAIDVAPDVPQGNVVEPGIDEKQMMSTAYIGAPVNINLSSMIRTNFNFGSYLTNFLHTIFRGILGFLGGL
ncbi:hypothetical protein QL285_064903 [Trifolium repens]|nr:hypothetical protein QL285_064903 [Trifolium repens]